MYDNFIAGSFFTSSHSKIGHCFTISSTFLYFFNSKNKKPVSYNFCFLDKIYNARTRPADLLVTNWDNGISAAFNVTVASPLNSNIITEAGMYSGAAARAAELRKHTQNDSKCAELSWKCIPLAVECYGAWGPEALKAFSQVATRLAIRGNTSKSMALTDLFGRLSHSLIRANARAILSRSYSHLMQQVDEL